MKRTAAWHPALALACAALLGSGCSLLLVRTGPPAQGCERQFPVTDAVIAAAATALTIVASVASVERGCDESPTTNCFETAGGKHATVGTLAGVSLLFGGSAVYGAIAVSRCPRPTPPIHF